MEKSLGCWQRCSEADCFPWTSLNFTCSHYFLSRCSWPAPAANNVAINDHWRCSSCGMSLAFWKPKASARFFRQAQCNASGETRRQQQTQSWLIMSLCGWVISTVCDLVPTAMVLWFVGWYYADWRRELRQSIWVWRWNEWKESLRINDCCLWIWSLQ